MSATQTILACYIACYFVGCFVICWACCVVAAGADRRLKEMADRRQARRSKTRIPQPQHHERKSLVDRQFLVSGRRPENPRQPASQSTPKRSRGIS